MQLDKNNKNIFTKVLFGKEKDVPLHSQNNGNGAERREASLSSEVLWTNDPSKVWKVRSTEQVKTLSILEDRSESRQKFKKKR